MRRILIFSIPVLILAGFIMLMNAGDYMKKPFSEEDRFLYYLNRAEEDVVNEDWDAAADHAHRLNRAWEIISPRIQFSVEKDEMIAISRSLARLNAFIAAADQGGAQAEINEIRVNWNHINK